MKPVRIALVEDHEIVRQGLSMLINYSDRDYEVVGECGTVAEVSAMVEKCKPDVILLDLKLPDGTGIDVCHQLKDKINQVKIIVLTSFAEKEDVYQAIAAGACGYILKQADSTTLLNAIEKASKGETLLDATTITKLVEYIQTNSNDLFEDLNGREAGILLLVAQGKGNKEIAKEVCLTEKTVRNYVSNIFSKLQVHNRSEAAVLASKNLANLRKKAEVD